MLWSCGLLLLGMVLVEAAPPPGPHPPPPPKYKHDDFDVSIALLGIVVFILGALYVLKSTNPTLRSGGWLAVSRAMSCYMGVLINMSLYGNLCFFLGAKKPTETPDRFTVCLDLGLFVFWWIVKQYATAASVGLVKFSADEDSIDLEVEFVAWRMESVGTLLGFVTASSAMQSLGSIQQMGKGTRFENTVILGVFPLAFLTALLVYRIGNIVRMHLSGQSGTISQAEASWGAYMDFAENKVMGLAISHITIQAIRIYMTGDYPTVMGQNLPGTVATMGQALSLLGWGLVFIIFSVALQKVNVSPRLMRMKQWLKMSSILAVAWCIFYAINWITASYLGKRTFSRLCQTTIATMIGTGLMLVLTAFSDALELHDDLAAMNTADPSGDSHDHEGLADILSRGAVCPYTAQVRDLLDRSNLLTKDRRKKGILLIQDLQIPAALLIGFSWRDAWQGALQVVTAQFPGIPPPVGMLIAGICMLALVYPAWHHYILPSMFIKWEHDKNLLKGGLIKMMTTGGLKPVFQLPRWLQQEKTLKHSAWKSRHSRMTKGGKARRRLHSVLLDEFGEVAGELVTSTKDGVDLLRASHASVRNVIVNKGVVSSAFEYAGMSQPSYRPTLARIPSAQVFPSKYPMQPFYA